MKKTQRLIALLLCLMLTIALSACSTKTTSAEEKKPSSGKVTYPLTIKDSYDRTVTLDKEPQRIVSIAPSITEIIFALGAESKLVGRTEYCDYPEQAKSIQTIGSLQEPSMEKIVELKPDVVIVSTHFKKETLQKLEELGLKVLVLYGQDSFDGAYEAVEKVGQVINTKDKADKIVSDMKKKVETVLDKVKGAKTKPSVYYVVGYGQYGDYTAGKGTFIAQMIEMVGGTNAANDVEGWQYSLERLVENNPNIMICSNLYDTKAGIMASNGYKDLDAVKNGKLLEIDINLLERQGPRLADGLETLAKMVHPELFK